MSNKRPERTPPTARTRVDEDLVARLHTIPTDDLLSLLRAGTPDEQRQAAIELGDRGEERAFDPLLSLLRHADDGVADGGALGLAELGDARAVEPLVDAIKDRRHRGIGAASLVWAVINLDPQRAVALLDGLVQEGSYMEAHHAAVGLRSTWEDLPPRVREQVRTNLRQRLEDTSIEVWRADFIDEILTLGGWTPEERDAWERGG
jgi:HEAT repeat protein